MTRGIVITRIRGIVYIESLPPVVVVIIIEFIIHSFRLSTRTIAEYHSGGPWGPINYMRRHLCAI